MQIVLLCSVVVVKLGIVATAAALLEMIADVATTVLEASLFMSGDFGPYNRLPDRDPARSVCRIETLCDQSIFVHFESFSKTARKCHFLMKLWIYV